MHSKTIPNNVINCWFVSEIDIARSVQDKRLYNEYIRPYAYFSLKSKSNDNSIAGHIGRYETLEDFHCTLQTQFTYIGDYLQKKAVYLTLDKKTLYKVTDLLPSKPLLFTLTRIDKLMINPEEIYQLLYKEQWSEIIKILHKHKKDITDDASLQFAAKTFETIFLQKADTLSLDSAEIREILETLYILHFGKFYLLSGDNLRRLSIELAKRLPLNDAFNYAKNYPEDDFCKALIAEYQNENLDKVKRQTYSTINYNWIEIYNRLFELINNQEDTATYFSGPRFINAVREIQPYSPTYTQYIQTRSDAGKSTSRKIFYYDLLMDQEPNVRVAIIEKILDIVRPFEPIKSTAIDILLGKNEKGESPNPTIIEKETLDNSATHPVVFISYSWDSEQHKEWVLTLANKLSNDGIEVLLDRYALKPGKSLPYFVEQSIVRSHRILIIFTPNYKLKADKRSGGVGYEYSIMNAALYDNQTNNEKVIPVLRHGEMFESIPDFMHQFIHMDMRNNENFEISYTDLLREIFDEPAIKQPEIGNKPIFK